MAWLPIDDLGTDVPDGRQVLGYDEDNRRVVATMRHYPDGSRYWIVSPPDLQDSVGVIMAPSFLTHYQELPLAPDTT